MADEMLEFLNALNAPVIEDDWKTGLDRLFSTLRKRFVFDNLAIYLSETEGGLLEVVYARAVGRGRSAEADAAWGESIANNVVTVKKIVRTAPEVKNAPDRVAMPHMLGLPLLLAKGAGALVFVRFGGPEYTLEQIPVALLIAEKVARIFERRFLREALVQLENARHYAQLQDDFVAAVSHDLHTPLGFIKGYTTSLLRSDTHWDADTQREFLTIVDEETDYLINLINRLLDSARLQSGVMAMEIQPVRLEALVRDVVLRVKDRLPSLDVVLNLATAPPIQADSIRLAQVFENLFDNAIKYAPASKVTISLRARDDIQTVIFTDQGPGIPPEHLPFIFERFYRIPNQPAAKRGTGLGLFICREIVRAHGGQISVETSPGKGTAFRIDLPVSYQSSG